MGSDGTVVFESGDILPLIIPSGRAGIGEALRSLRIAWSLCRPLPTSAELASYSLVRLSALEEFWSRGVPELEARWTEVLRGLSALRGELIVMVVHRGEEFGMYVCEPRQSASQGSAIALVSAGLPGSTMTEVAVARQRADVLNLLSRGAHVVSLSGVPERRSTGKRIDTGLVSRLTRALPATDWAFVVRMTPVPQEALDEPLRRLSQAVSAVSPWVEPSLPGEIDGTVRQKDPLAEEYVRCADAEFDRLFRASRSGMFAVQASFFAEDALSAQVFRAAVTSALGGEGRTRELRAGVVVDGQAPVSFLTSSEAALLTRPPAEEVPGLQVREYARFDTHPPAVVVDDRIRLGFVAGREEVSIDIPLDDMTRHSLVVGMTGSGKTTQLWGLLGQLQDRPDPVPYLVIEPVKREYRDLPFDPPPRVYTVGDERVSPLRLNPFEVPRGILIQTHIDLLDALFRASFAMYPPMPYILERCLYEVYVDRGWNLASDPGSSPAGAPRFPTLTDLRRKVEEVSARLGYGNEVTMNVRAALLTRIDTLRLGAKGAMLDTHETFDTAAFLAEPTVVELERVGNDQEKSFLMGLLLTRVFEHRQAAGDSGGRLLHVTVIEEAHRLLRQRPSSGDPESADPGAHAVEQFASMLAEVRSLGEGIVVSEQIPAKLSPDVIKNTGSKIVLRLAAEDDKRSVGSTINLDDEQSRVLTSLPRGEAIVFLEGMDRPVRIRALGADVRARAVNRRKDAEIRNDMVTPATGMRLDRSGAPTAFADSLAREPAFVRLLTHWALAALTGTPRVLIQEHLTQVLAARCPDGWGPALWAAEVMRRELPEVLQRIGIDDIDFEREVARAVTGGASPYAGLDAGAALLGERPAREAVPMLAPCNDVCERDCVLRTLAGLAADSEMTQRVRKAALETQADRGHAQLLDEVRAAGYRVLTELEPSLPLRVGACALISQLAVDHPTVAAEVVRDMMKAVRERGGVQSGAA